MSKVFISYSHDSPEHIQLVLQLANTLRGHGVDAELDQYHVRPPQGWPRWCEEQLRPENSEFVLVVCSKIYRDRVEGKTAADEGRGVLWEGGIIYSYLYNEKGNKRFIPVLLPGAKEDGIPRPLADDTRYYLEAFDLKDVQYQALYRELTRQPLVSKPKVGNIVPLPMLEVRTAFIPEVKRSPVFYLLASLTGTPDQSSATVFYKVEGESLARSLCSLFTKEYTAASGRPAFCHKAATSFSVEEQVLLDESLEGLDVYRDPDPGLYDLEPSKETLSLAQFTIRAQEWEELLKKRTKARDQNATLNTEDAVHRDPATTDALPEMSAEDRRNSGLILLMLLAQAYYKLLECTISMASWCTALDLELNQSYLWTVKNITNLLKHHEGLKNFPVPFEPLFPDLYPSTIRDLDWEDMVAPDAERFLSTVQQFVYSKGIYDPEEGSPAWLFIELFRPSVNAAVERAIAYNKKMRQHCQKVSGSSPFAAPGISAGGSIQAGKNIEAGGKIQAGRNIEAGGNIQSGCNRQKTAMSIKETSTKAHAETGKVKPMPLSKIPDERRGLQRITGCDNAHRALDIVFIHGLGGDSWTTWMADKDDIQTFWPNWLAEDFPQAGLWTLGYAASGSKWKEESMPLADRGNQVLDLLANDGIGERPLVFITHSMGGIVAKQILRHAESFGVRRWEAIAQQAVGLAFIATPHSGAHIANFAELASAVYRTNEHVKELAAHDPRLRELHGWFLHYQSKHHVICRTYCEKREIRPEIPLLGIKLLKGVLVVNETSAEPNIPGERAIPLDEDHVSICKPTTREALLYKGVLRLLNECLMANNRPLPSLLQTDAASDPASQTSPAQAAPRRPSVLAMWQKKLAFLQTEEAKAEGAGQRFAIQELIEEAKAKIREHGGNA